jgi:hypothetical protein
MNRFGSGSKYWNQCIEPQPTSGVKMTLKVKVTQGQMSTLYAKYSGLHGESNRSNQMTFKVKVKVNQGQTSLKLLSVETYTGKLAVARTYLKCHRSGHRSSSVSISVKCADLHCESFCDKQITLKVKVKVTQSQTSAIR